MEHIVQFAIGIDDDAIVKLIEESAEKKITDEIKQEVMKLMFECNPYSGKRLEYPTNWTRMQIESFLVGHKEEIIQCAGNILAEKLMRTKAVKEMLGGLVEDQ
jgi:hypothetical protein